MNKQRLASLSLHLGVGTQSGKAQKQKKERERESLLNVFKAKYPKGLLLFFRRLADQWISTDKWYKKGRVALAKCY